jgi:Subtilase family/Bacterial Ig-like domain (group 3)
MSTFLQRHKLGLRSGRTWITAAGLAAIGAGLVSTATGQVAPPPKLAPFVAKAVAIPDQYIVVLKAGTTEAANFEAQAQARQAGAVIGFTYKKALNGFSFKGPQAAVDRLRTIATVDYVSADSPVKADIIQVAPPLGLDRTSERLLPLNNWFTYSQDGTGVHAYVIDTGIRPTHNDFAPSRATGDFTSIMDANGTNDCNGHGTHVAGTIGGTTYGIAKNVRLHGVRVLDCGGSGSEAGVIAGVDWVTLNAIFPAVANMSLGASGVYPAMNTAVANSIASGITYTISAGNSNANACVYSPALVPQAITVGSVHPSNDTRSWFSNWGTCLDLFAPGESILSAWFSSDSATNTINGTSMAAPHVAGVAALFLQLNPAASPSAVWAGVLANANVTTTLGWPGIIAPMPGDPNVLLHWGSLNNGYDDGDPHLTTVEGVHYDFQSAGEFTLLRDGNGTEIQARQSPVQTTTRGGTNPYTGLATCVSLNTAVAAKVGGRRISYVPNVSGFPDPSGLQLRIDGVLTTLPAGGINLAPGAHIGPIGGGGINVTFPDGTTMYATPHWWAAHSKWYLNISIFHTPASEGILGFRPSGSWLPALPGGGSMGPMPANLSQRYSDLNVTYANAWRVTSTSSLFDYAAGKSTADFTYASWPLETGACIIPQLPEPPAEPTTPTVARNACKNIVDQHRRADCIADVLVTGEVGFADAQKRSEQIVAGATRTRIDAKADVTAPQQEATFTITVSKHAGGADATSIPNGVVQVFVDGRRSGELTLDDNGRAVWKTFSLTPGEHNITASYLAPQGSIFLPSQSLPLHHIVRDGAR